MRSAPGSAGTATAPVPPSHTTKRANRMSDRGRRLLRQGVLDEFLGVRHLTRYADLLKRLEAEPPLTETV